MNSSFVRPHTSIPETEAALKAEINEAINRAGEGVFGGRTAHNAIVTELLRELDTCIPFPNSIVNGHDLYTIKPHTIEVSSHEFELVKLIHAINWIVRLALTKNGGSATKRPESFASRQMSDLRIQLARSAADHDTAMMGPAAAENDAVMKERRMGRRALTSAVIESGNCGESANFAFRFFNGDIPLLTQMGIKLFPEQLDLYLMRDWPHDHAYVLIEFTRPDSSPTSEDTFASSDRLEGLWVVDPHQLYPMPIRYDNALYNHPHTVVTEMKKGSLYRPDVLDLGHARAAREDLIAHLGLGPDGINKALQYPVMVEKGIRSEFVEEIVQSQGVTHYAQVDIAKLSKREHARFEREVGKLERQVGITLVGSAYQNGQYVERWEGLCPARNPAVTYRNAETGEIFAPTVPAAYMERTERNRWAYNKWKATRPSVEDLKSGKAEFDIHPAVEAIEQMPFLSALAAARAMDFSKNALHVERITDFESALRSMEEWIGRMHHDLTKKQASVIRQVELQDEVIDSLRRVQGNLKALLDNDQLKADRSLKQWLRANNVLRKMEKLLNRFEAPRG